MPHQQVRLAGAGHHQAQASSPLAKGASGQWRWRRTALDSTEIVGDQVGPNLERCNGTTRLLFQGDPTFSQFCCAEQQVIGHPQCGLDLRLRCVEPAMHFRGDAAGVVRKWWWGVFWIEEQIIEVHHHWDALTTGLRDQAE